MALCPVKHTLLCRAWAIAHPIPLLLLLFYFRFTSSLPLPVLSSCNSLLFFPKFSSYSGSRSVQGAVSVHMCVCPLYVMVWPVLAVHSNLLTVLCLELKSPREHTVTDGGMAGRGEIQTGGQGGKKQTWKARPRGIERRGTNGE